MPTLTELHLYPIKSCAGISLSSATATPTGLMSGQLHDRQWMVVNADGVFLTQREYPAMARIVPSMRADTLMLQAPGMPPLELTLALPNTANTTSLPVTIWDDTVHAYDCGDTAATWFSQTLATPCRLVRCNPQHLRQASSRWTDGRATRTLFADGFPMLIISEASLADLNGKLQKQGRMPLPMNRFRPNLVIAGVEAYEEDYAASIRIGKAQVKPVKPCPRCPIPSIDQATGIVGPDPLDILQGYRANPLVDGGITFGMNAILLNDESQLLEIGQDIEFELAF